MNNRKSEIRPSAEFERALAQCTREDFDGHTEFYRLTLSNGSNGYARQQPSFTNSKAKPTLALGANRDNGLGMVFKRRRLFTLLLLLIVIEILL